MSVHQGVLHALSLAPNNLPAMATFAQSNSATVSRDFKEGKTEKLVVFFLVCVWLGGLISHFTDAFPASKVCQLGVIVPTRRCKPCTCCLHSVGGEQQGVRLAAADPRHRRHLQWSELSLFWENMFECTVLIIFDILCVRTGSLSARTGRTGSAHPASPLAGRGSANHKHRFRHAD